MQRGITGRYEVNGIGGEQVRAFVLHPLPPNPPLDLSSRDRPGRYVGAAEVDEDDEPFKANCSLANSRDLYL